ncbi:MAG: helix-turn-helix domain-containing protein [Schleiferiaceae bacterium]|nr:helix-turn-helix domain-containing protein [Schleiferiaceae bacterium]
MEEIVQRLKAYIEQEGHTPSSMASVLDINRSTLVHIMNGRNKPNLQLIQKLCVFDENLDLRYLLTGERSKKSISPQIKNASTETIKNVVSAPPPSKATSQKLLVLNPNGTWETYTKEA